MKTILIFTLLFSIQLFSDSKTDRYISKIQEKALKLELQNSKDWHLLLHYKKDVFGNIESLIDDEQFFVSDIGKYNSKEELLKTIQSFFKTSYDKNSTLTAKCIFVERFRWLDEKLNFDKNIIPKTDCPRFKSWLDEVGGEQIAIIFASSYMNNPSSMFGHTFLRIDKKIEKNRLLLSYALNYSASTGSDNGILFAFKGIFGSYPAYFSVSPYFEKIKQYNDLENRDLYEYILNLNQEEIRRLIYHTWELHFFKSDYFFFKENCSYNILTLLEYARPSLNLTENFSVFAIPSDTIKAISQNRLISNTVYRASKKSEISNLLNNISQNSKNLAIQIIEQKLKPKDIIDMNISKTEKIDILELSYSYVNYLRLKHSYRYGSPKKLQMSILINRSSLGKRDKDLAKPEKPKFNIEDSHKVSRFSFGYYRENENRGFQFRIKPSYHELLDSQDGYIDGAEISFFNFMMRFDEEFEKYIFDMKLLEIKSFASYGDIFQPKSWRFQTGVKRVFEDISNIYYINGAIGLTFGKYFKFYSLLSLDYEYGKDLSKDNAIFGGINIGIFGSISNSLRTNLDIKIQESPLSYSQEKRYEIKWSNNYLMNRDRSIIFELSKKMERENISKDISAFYQIYF